MKFGRFPVEDCVGAILAHSVRDDDILLEKGRTLAAEDIVTLQSVGLTDIMAAFLEDGDVAEDAAAGRIAKAIAGRGLECRPAARGRVNIHARRLSLFEIASGTLDKLNAVNEGISIATLARFSIVGSGQLVATVKIIPFSLPGGTLNAVETIVDNGGGISARAYEAHNIGLIQTELPGTAKKLLVKTCGVLGARLDRLGSRIARNAIVPHHEGRLAEAIVLFAEEGLSPIMIMGASATLDRNDVVPEAIRRAGGDVIRFGMPVDPGNLLVLGRRHDISIIGLPGCARSPSPNGFDNVLEMVLAGVDVTAGDISQMGIGGLLKEGAGRPQPRELQGKREASAVTRTAAIVLAAGLSRRMGADNKLLAATPGGTLVTRAVATLLDTPVDRIIVVLGHQSDDIRETLKGCDAEFITNADFEAGMGTSIACGIGALDDEFDAALVVLGDMPLVKPETIRALINNLDPGSGITVAAPTYLGKRGNPVIWDRVHFAELRSLQGDTGARDLLAEVGDALCLLAVDDPGVLFDVDTRDALKRMD